MYTLAREDGFQGQAPFRAILPFIGAKDTASSLSSSSGHDIAFLAAVIRNAGLRTVDDIVTDAMLNPERARLLLSKAKPAEEGARFRDLVSSYARAALQALTDEEKPRDDEPASAQDLRSALRLATISSPAKRQPGNLRSASDCALSNVRATVARDHEARQAILDARNRQIAHLTSKTDMMSLLPPASRWDVEEC